MQLAEAAGPDTSIGLHRQVGSFGADCEWWCWKGGDKLEP